jgi:hypothetical protein
MSGKSPTSPTSPTSTAAATSPASTTNQTREAAVPAPGPRPVLWYDLPTAAGRFTLSPVKPDRDLPLIARWMNDPEVARYWALDGPAERTAHHVHTQLAQSHVQPLLARLSGRPIGTIRPGRTTWAYTS